MVPRSVGRSCRCFDAVERLRSLGHLTLEQAPTPHFDPITFFAGRTQGTGSLKVLTKRRQQTLVEGHGTVTSDGGIVLDQDVRRSGVLTRRTWRLHRVAADRYAGTLSDASGPVSGEVTGNRLHLSFAMKGGLHAEQWLYLQPDKQSARNRMVVTKLGIPVASLDETIQRMPTK